MVSYDYWWWFSIARVPITLDQPVNCERHRLTGGLLDILSILSLVELFERLDTRVYYPEVRNAAVCGYWSYALEP